MGSSFMSFDEAASRLGRTKRSIHNYIKQGFLTKVIQDGQPVVKKEDVEQLAVEMGADMPALNRKNFFLLMSKIQRLEEKMAVVQRILEIRDDPLRPDKMEAGGLYKAATEALSRVGKWTKEEIEMWAKLFDRFDETTLDSIQAAVVDSKPWVPFFQLCTGMMAEVRKNDQTWESLALHKKLDEGRKRIRGVILMWVESGRGTIPSSFLKVLDSQKEVLLRRLAERKTG